MPRPSQRFIKNLTPVQVKNLKRLRDAGGSSRARHRAHSILLSYQGKSIGELVSIFEVNRTTIGLWLDRWESSGLAGLEDRGGQGAPSKLTDAERSQVIEILGESPHNPSLVLAQVEKKIGKQISSSTLKRIAKKAGLVWKRARKSLASKQDPKKNLNTGVN